jgi:hypothetical protein
VRKRPVRIRKVWIINPKTRVKESKKIYRRHKFKEETRRAIKE